MSTEFNPDWVSPPGGTLRDILVEKKMTKEELADLVQIPVEEMERILDGRAGMSERFRQQLEFLFGTPKRFWDNRWANYYAGLEKGKRVDG